MLPLNSCKCKVKYLVTSKLQQAFRHIRDLCGKYLQFQGGSYTPPYIQPLGQPMNNQPYFMPPYYPSNQSYVPGVTNGYGMGIKDQKQTGFNGMNSNSNSKMMMNNSKNITQQSQQQGNNRMNGFSKANQMQQMIDKGKGVSNGFNNMGNNMNNNMGNNMNNNMGNNMGNNMNNNNNTKFPLSSNPSNRPIIPQPPSSAQAVFLSSKKFQIRKQYPQLNNQQIRQIMSEVWKSFTNEQKQPYQQQYQKLKRQYEQKIKQQINRSVNQNQYNQQQQQQYNQNNNNNQQQQNIVKAVKNQIKKNN